MVDSCAREAIQRASDRRRGEQIEERDLREAVLDAAALMLATICENDAELKYQRAEIEQYRDRLIDIARFTPQPIFLSADPGK